MSRDKGDVVRRMYDAWIRDDLEAFLSVMDAEVEWHPAIERGVEGMEAVYRGIEGMREFWTIRRTEFEDFEYTSEELRDLGDGRVLHLAHMRWRGAASGIEVESPIALVVSVRAGKIVRSMAYLSHEEALEAVGLRRWT